MSNIKNLFDIENKQIIESLKDDLEVCNTENNTLTQEKNILTGSLTDIVEKLRVCNSRPRNTDITGMSSFISDQISKMSANDVLMAEEVNVGDFLSDDKDNIVFVIDGKFATIISKENLNLEDPTSLFYECIKVNSFSRENTTGPKLFALRKIGGVHGGLVLLEDVQKIKKDSTKNAFVLEKVKRIETLISMDVLDNNRIIGGTHCQPGLNDTVYKVSFGIHIGDPIVGARGTQVERVAAQETQEAPATRVTQDEQGREALFQVFANRNTSQQQVPATREERLERIRIARERVAAQAAQEVPVTQEERLEQIRVENEELVARERERLSAQAAAAREAQEVATQDEINQRRIVRGIRERRVPAIR